MEDSAADKRDSTYHFKLPHFEEIDSDDVDSGDDDDNGDDDDGNEPVPKRQRDESPDVIQSFINYFPNFQSLASDFPESDHNKSRNRGYVVDAKYYGNIARFINVSLPLL